MEEEREETKKKGDCIEEGSNRKSSQRSQDKGDIVPSHT
jgi:hypothetical protein